MRDCNLLSHFSQRKFNWMRWSAADQRKKLAAEDKNYCMYFNRFGRCSRGDKCVYIHDPDKVSVCTRLVMPSCFPDYCYCVYFMCASMQLLSFYFIFMPLPVHSLQRGHYAIISSHWPSWCLSRVRSQHHLTYRVSGAGHRAASSRCTLAIASHCGHR